MLALFAGAMTMIARTGGKAFVESIRLRFENAELVQHLSSARERMASANELLEARVTERTGELEKTLAQQKRSEVALARFRALLDQTGVAVLVAHPEDLTILDANESARTMLGLGRAQLLQRRLHEVDIAKVLATREQ